MSAEGKTIRQIADEIGVDKQRVYRYIRRNHISEAYHEDGVMWYSDADEKRIKQWFLEIDNISEAHRDVHQSVSGDAVVDALITALQQQLETKDRQMDAKDQQIAARDKQISELTVALENVTEGLRAAQALHAGTMQNQLTSGADRDEDVPAEPPKNKKGWQFWKK